ncbi:MAG: Coenzyme F420 hydrogenase/dehydrogenase, beta subunit C-terminal domain [Candidatus Odinarchaeota archaeon]
MEIKAGNDVLAWSTDEKIRERGASGGAVTALIKTALETGMADYAMGIRKKGDLEHEVVLTKDPKEVETFAGALHMAPVNQYDQVVDALEKGRVVMALKPCEVKAIRLNTLRNQLDRKRLILIGLNCGGTVDPKAAPAMLEKFYGVEPSQVEKEEILHGKFIVEMKDGTHKAIKIDDLEEAGYGRRPNCQRCVSKIPIGTDIAAGNWGVPKDLTGKATYIAIQTDEGAELVEKGLQKGTIKVTDTDPDEAARRLKTAKFMEKLALKWRKRYFENFEGQLREERLKLFLEEVDRCTACGKCQDVCPACTCGIAAKCLDFANMRAEKPEERNKLLFHFIRIYHMLDLCIACGQCSLVCEATPPIDVSSMITRYAFKRQQIETWLPGVSEGELPILRTK